MSNVCDINPQHENYETQGFCCPWCYADNDYHAEFDHALEVECVDCHKMFAVQLEKVTKNISGFIRGV